jgi:26 proteasome complex subunit DSS1
MADWTQEDTEAPGDNTHLWEESWDDDDTSEDFSAQLKWVICRFLC